MPDGPTPGGGLAVVRSVADLRAFVAAERAAGRRIGLVPTMGALHDGHLALIRRAAEECGAVVVSLFVNPTQFGEGEDFTAYPRDEARDAALAREAGARLLYAPEVAEMYPPGDATRVTVSGLSEGLCGDYRPGHFAGVATVVAKLFAQCAPDTAYFGEKDYQQLLVIRRLARDLHLPVEVVGVPIVRDADGLALSSRNAYLSAAERSAALALYRTLRDMASNIEAGADIAETLAAGRAAIAEAGFAPIDYVELRDAETLRPVDRLDRPARLLAAATMGRARLIDNVPVTPRG